MRREQGITDAVPRWKHLKLASADDRQPHNYQQEALRAWLEAGGQGSLVLSTGPGKTFRLAGHGAPGMQQLGRGPHH